MRQHIWLAGLSPVLSAPALAKEPPVRIDYMLPATSVAAAQSARAADNAAIKRRLDAAKNGKDLEALLKEEAVKGATS